MAKLFIELRVIDCAKLHNLMTLIGEYEGDLPECFRRKMCEILTLDQMDTIDVLNSKAWSSTEKILSKFL